MPGMSQDFSLFHGFFTKTKVPLLLSALAPFISLVQLPTRSVTQINGILLVTFLWEKVKPNYTWKTFLFNRAFMFTPHGSAQKEGVWPSWDYQRTLISTLARWPLLFRNALQNAHPPRSLMPHSVFCPRMLPYHPLQFAFLPSLHSFMQPRCEESLQCARHSSFQAAGIRKWIRQNFLCFWVLHPNRDTK